MLNPEQIKEVKLSINSHLKLLSMRICPEPKIRLNFSVLAHFCERLTERFSYPYYQMFLKDIYEWVDKDYCINLYLINRGDYKINQEIVLKNGVLVVTFFENKITLKTCYKEIKC